MSYLERVLIHFLKNYVFGGLAKLRQKKYFPFTIMMTSVMLLNTVVGILYNFNILFGLEFLRFSLRFELFLSFAIITSGLVIGRIKNPLLYYTLAIFIFLAYIIIFLIFSQQPSFLIYESIKLIYFLIWVALTSISLFFLTIYFFTSFPKKVITLGMPKNHVFFGFLLKLVAFISLPFYMYLIYRTSLGNVITGGLGMLITLITLYLLYRAPKEAESRAGLINLATAIGFYNITIFYHLLMSFSTLSTSTTSFLIDIIILFITILYLVQSMTKRISESPARQKPQESLVTFQTRVYFTDRVKRILGEPGTVLVVMGIALGYHVVTLDSFFIESLAFLAGLFPSYLEFSSIYHRLYLFFSFCVVLLFILAYLSSERTRDLLVDKYTISQAFKYIGALFKKEEGEPCLAEIALTEFGKKIDAGIKTIGDKWKNSLDKLIKKDER
ncbi:MAG: hypothetical protein ACTSXH_07605, partial [Promethearchaeota archaeon]